MIDERSNPKKEARLTLRVLLDNSVKVQGPLKQDRNIKIKKIAPYAGVRWVRFDITSTGDPEEGKFYDLVMIFYDVSFSEEKDSRHTVPLKIIQRGGPHVIRWMEQLRITKHPVAVWCACRSFQFRNEWYLEKVGSLAPRRKPRPYTRKTTTRPSVNVLKLPSVCKHLYMASLELQTRGFLVNR